MIDNKDKSVAQLIGNIEGYAQSIRKGYGDPVKCAEKIEKAADEVFRKVYKSEK